MADARRVIVLGEDAYFNLLDGRSGATITVDGREIELAPPPGKRVILCSTADDILDTADDLGYDRDVVAEHLEEIAHDLESDYSDSLDGYLSLTLGLSKDADDDDDDAEDE